MAQTGFPNWSQTASSNATSDGSANWAEGQAPSSVNDAARAMMASLAKWRDDNSGALVTGGTSTAYTLTTNQVFDSLTSMNGQTIRVKFNATNGASPTLNVDSLGAKAIQWATGTAVPTGSIIANTIHDLLYDSSNAVWILIGRLNAGLEAPAGTKMLFQQTAAPTGWTKDTTHNDKALRLVSGTASTGGSTAFTSVLTSRSIAQANLPAVTLSVTGQVSMTNILQLTGSAVQVPSGSTYNMYPTGSLGTVSSPSISGTSAALGSGTAMDFAVQYVDVIIATKD